MTEFTAPAALVGLNVKVELARQRITQAALGRELGLPQASVSARLRGVTPFDINELVRVGAVLDVSLVTLLRGVDDDELILAGARASLTPAEFGDVLAGRGRYGLTDREVEAVRRAYPDLAGV